MPDKRITKIAKTEIDTEANRLVESVRRKVLDDFIRECPPDLQERIEQQLAAMRSKTP